MVTYIVGTYLFQWARAGKLVLIYAFIYNYAHNRFPECKLIDFGRTISLKKMCLRPDLYELVKAIDLSLLFGETCKVCCRMKQNSHFHPVASHMKTMCVDFIRDHYKIGWEEKWASLEGRVRCDSNGCRECGRDSEVVALLLRDKCLQLVGSTISISFLDLVCK